MTLAVRPIARSLLHARRVAVLAVMALALAATPAGAASPVRTGSGEGLITALVIDSEREAGRVRFEDRTISGVVSGTLEGTFVQRVSGVVTPNGRVSFTGSFTFTGTIEGCGPEEQTVRLGVAGRGEIPTPGFPLTSANVWLQESDGALKTGWGKVEQAGPNLTYDVGYVCS
jgi:hypothetical protein